MFESLFFFLKLSLFFFFKRVHRFQKQTILAVDELPILYKIFGDPSLFVFPFQFLFVQKRSYFSDSVEEDYLPLGELPQVHSKGFFFVYSITSRHSFEEIEPYIRQTERLKDDTVIKGIGVLIGNKVDLEEDRVVSRKEGEELAKRHQIPFFETSAKTPVNVEEMFQALGSLVISGEAFYQCLAGQNIKAARK